MLFFIIDDRYFLRMRKCFVIIVPHWHNHVFQHLNIHFHQLNLVSITNNTAHHHLRRFYHHLIVSYTHQKRLTNSINSLIRSLYSLTFSGTQQIFYQKPQLHQQSLYLSSLFFISDASYSFHPTVSEETFVRRKQRRNRTTFTLQQVSFNHFKNF